jgi:hypothetical protein
MAWWAMLGRRFAQVNRSQGLTKGGDEHQSRVPQLRASFLGANLGSTALKSRTRVGLFYAPWSTTGYLHSNPVKRGLAKEIGG